MIEDKLKKIIAEILNLVPNKITSEAFFEDDLGTDSLDCVEIIMAIEMEFNIDIFDEEADEIKTVRDVINYIKQKCGESE
ncbi:acyl carrier protein [Candidatus Babeliales bacterium]|nr:acyl carrier protein [Candidatus Babeliales bacterium]